MNDPGEPLRYPSDDCIEAYAMGMAIKRLQVMLGFALGETSEFDNPPLGTESAVASELASLERAFKQFHAALTDDKPRDYERSARAFFRMQQQLGRRTRLTRDERPDENAAMFWDLWKSVDDLEIGIHAILEGQDGKAISWFNLGLEICHIEVRLSEPTSYFLAAKPRPWPEDVDRALGQWKWMNPARVRALFDELCPGQNFPSCPGSNEPLPLPFIGLHNNDSYHELWLELLLGSELLHPPCTELELQEKAPIRKKRDDRSDASQYEYLAQQARLKISLDPPQAEFNGRSYSLDAEEAVMLDALLNAHPKEVTWKNIVAEAPDLLENSRPKRVIGKLRNKSPALAAVIQTKPGKGIWLEFDDEPD